MDGREVGMDPTGRPVQKTADKVYKAHRKEAKTQMLHSSRIG